MHFRKLAIMLGLAAVFPAAQWLIAQERGGRGSGAQRDLLYAAVPGRVDDIGFGGIGLVVFDASRNFRFVKRIATWEYPAAQSPENVKGVAVSASLGMIYVSTIKRLAAWDLLTEKKVWEQTYDGQCCDRMAMSPDGRTQDRIGLPPIVLEIGSTGEAVTVEASVEQLQTISAERSGVLTGSQMVDLASNTRNFADLLKTVAGFNVDTNNANGLLTDQNAIAVDGTSVMEAGGHDK